MSGDIGVTETGGRESLVVAKPTSVSAMVLSLVIAVAAGVESVDFESSNLMHDTKIADAATPRVRRCLFVISIARSL
jgi:hypothetical protein